MALTTISKLVEKPKWELSHSETYIRSTLRRMSRHVVPLRLVSEFH